MLLGNISYHAYPKHQIQFFSCEIIHICVCCKICVSPVTLYVIHLIRFLLDQQKLLTSARSVSESCTFLRIEISQPSKFSVKKLSACHVFNITYHFMVVTEENFLTFPVMSSSFASFCYRREHALVRLLDEI